MGQCRGVRGRGRDVTRCGCDGSIIVNAVICEGNIVWVACTPDVNETQERHELKECSDVSVCPATDPIEEFTDRNVQITDHTMAFLVGSPSPPLCHKHISFIIGLTTISLNAKCPNMPSIFNSGTEREEKAHDAR
jgi:hypothetical protein